MSNIRKGKNTDPSGRTETQRYVKIAHGLMDSRAFMALSPNAKCVLLTVFARYVFPGNNGRFFMSLQDIANAIGLADKGDARGPVNELIDHGFVKVTRPGSFTIKCAVTGNRRATEYRVTFIKTKSGPATNDYLDWNPEPRSKAAVRLNRCQKIKLRGGISPRAGGDSTPNAAIYTPSTGGDFTPANGKKPAIQDPDTGGDFAPQTVTWDGEFRLGMSACARLRAHVDLWLDNTGSTQSALAPLAGLSPTKLSRFLSRDTATLTERQAHRLFEATSPKFEVHVPANPDHLRRQIFG